jgi:uncharacterized membrane protein YczE
MHDDGSVFLIGNEMFINSMNINGTSMSNTGAQTVFLMPNGDMVMPNYDIYIFICTITIITFVVVFPKLHEATIPTIALYALFIVITINLSAYPNPTRFTCQYFFK